jgi:hypothetical protein
MELKDIQFKDVVPYTKFFLYGEEYLKVGNTKCIWVARDMQAECDPDNWVQIAVSKI